MPFRPNYSQQRNDRNRAKEQKKQERLQRREEGSRKRKAEQESVRDPNADAASPGPGANEESE